MPYEELHDESHRQVSAILVESGLVKGTAEEIDAQGMSRAFYPHGLGHSLGLVDARRRLREPAPARRQPVPAQHLDHRRGSGLHDRARPLLHRRPARASCAPSPRASSSTGTWSRRSAVRRHPHRGRRSRPRKGVRNFTREVLPIGGATVLSRVVVSSRRSARRRRRSSTGIVNVVGVLEQADRIRAGDRHIDASACCSGPCRRAPRGEVAASVCIAQFEEGRYPFFSSSIDAELMQ